MTQQPADGSISVNAATRGRCEPHLHVQLTDGPDGNYARGIPLIFANGRPVLFSSTLDTGGRRQLQTGEFVETVR